MTELRAFETAQRAAEISTDGLHRADRNPPKNKQQEIEHSAAIHTVAEVSPAGWAAIQLCLLPFHRAAGVTKSN